MAALPVPTRSRTFYPQAPAVSLLDNVELGYLMAGVRRSLKLGESVHRPLREMLATTLDHPGSMIRAQLAFLIARHSPVGRVAARSLAVAIEYFHTASLVFDDLPMMDDSTERRGHPCAHVAFGEATATLGALGLINHGYALLWSVLESIPGSRARRAAALVESALGVDGILSGQSRDLAFGESAGGEDAIREVADGKTVSLIRLTLVVPALVGGANEATLRWLERLSVAWGLAYQGLDDCKDCLDSHLESGKSSARDGALGRPNLCNHLGLPRTLERLRETLDESERLLNEPPTDEWPELAKLQGALAGELARVERRVKERPITKPVSLVPRCPTAI